MDLKLEDGFWLTLSSTVLLLLELVRRHRRDSLRPRAPEPPPRERMGSGPSVTMGRLRALRTTANTWEHNTVSDQSAFDEGYGAGVHYCGQQLNQLLDRLGIDDDGDAF